MIPIKIVSSHKLYPKDRVLIIAKKILVAKNVFDFDVVQVDYWLIRFVWFFRKLCCIKIAIAIVMMFVFQANT